MDEFTEFSPGEKCLGLFYMGYYDGDLPEGERGPLASKIKWLN